jgi:hypothetical protein
MNWVSTCDNSSTRSLSCTVGDSSSHCCLDQECWLVEICRASASTSHATACYNTC